MTYNEKYPKYLFPINVMIIEIQSILNIEEFNQSTQYSFTYTINYNCTSFGH